MRRAIKRNTKKSNRTGVKKNDRRDHKTNFKIQRRPRLETIPQSQRPGNLHFPGSRRTPEVFQWSGTDVSNEGKQEKIKEEIADVLNYCVVMADASGLDIDEIVREKIKVNDEKYPVSKAKGKKEKYNKL